MSTTLIFAIAVFIGITALIVAVVSMFQGKQESAAEERLEVLTTGAAKKKSGGIEANLLRESFNESSNALIAYFRQALNLDRYIEQAGVRTSASKLIFISLGLAAGGLVFGLLTPVALIAGPVLALLVAPLPFVWLYFKRGSRLKRFAKQLPEALELLSRALRAGHSLGAGFSLVAQEMPQPISQEFNRAFEEQNLGVPLDESLDDMTARVPNLDLRFFATSVILQRTTGGDLAEILDKIGYIIRERYQIFGQVQALTGEGRLSGIVLLALPPVLFLVMLKLNFEYVMMLFHDPMGQQMLAGGVVAQVLGALVIRKIINIKV